MVERELLAAKREVIEKDQTISNLEEHVSILQASFDRSGFHGDRSEVNALKNKCEVYLKQIEEMEVSSITEYDYSLQLSCLSFLPTVGVFE